MKLVNLSKEEFKKFEDEKTKVFYVIEKPECDKYCAYAVDAVIQQIPKDQDCWIYLLDDDNLIGENFAELGEECNIEKPVVVFNIKVPKISNGFDGTIKGPFQPKKVLYHIDAANYIVHRTVFDTCKFGNKIKSAWSDGIFM